MSTILKALRRLEEDKAAAPQRPLREEVAAWVPSPARPGALRRWAPAAAALVAGALGGGLLFWLTQGPAAAPSSERPLAGAVAAAPEAAAAPPPLAATPAPLPEIPERASAPLARSERAGPPDAAFASDVEIVQRPRAAPRVADDEPLQLRPREGPGARRPVQDSAAARARREEALRRIRAAQETARAAAPPALAERAAAPEPAPRIAAASEATSSEAAASEAASSPERAEPAPTPEVTERAPEPAEREAAPDAPPAPTPAETASSPSSQASEPPPAPEAAAPPEPSDAPPPPAIAVQRTQWHPLPERRSAWVVVGAAAEARRVAEGDAVADLRVEAIEPSAVVFDRGGETVRRRVGR